MEDKHKQFAKRWFDYSKRSSDYMEFLCHYVCLEVLTKSKVNDIKFILEQLDLNIHAAILKNCSNQVDFFKTRIIHNAYHNARVRSTLEYAKTLNNPKKRDMDKIMAMLDICKIVRGNIIHGHKEFDNPDDRNITTAGNIFFRSLFHHIFR